jgi:dTDP-glucose 4,6-dehydratase
MTKYLITGGLGFIGSNFVNYLSSVQKESFFVVLDKKDYCSSLENIHPSSNVEVVIGNISNHELVMYILTKYQIDIVVHFAAQSHVDNSFFNSIPFTESNVLGTHSLLESCRAYQHIKRFIHISTDEVYGEVTDGVARSEKSLLNPTNPYAASKAAAEFFVKSYYYSYQLPVIITRGNNVFGPNQYPEKVIPKFICQLLDDKPITVQGTGLTKRNFIHVDDVCTAIECILEKGVIGETYNISAPHENEFTVLELGKMICGVIGVEEKIVFIEDRKFNDYRYYISNDKLKELGWTPVKLDFKEELKKLVEWYRVNKGRYAS